MQTFTAHVQYGDWKGTAAADNSDGPNSLRTILEKKGAFGEEDFLLAAQMFVGENHNNKLSAKPYIRAYLYKGVHNFEEMKDKLSELETSNEPIPVREVTIELSLQEFVALFKRFEVMLTWHGLPLHDREYSVTEEV